jgi:branched-chain amino acid transport system substrate-binding protein
MAASRLKLVLAISVMAVVSLSAPASGQDDEPIKVGLSGALTGGDAFLGAVQQEGVRLAVDEINAAGGIGGRQIQIVTEDEANDPSRMAEIALKFINSDRVDAIIGGTNDGTAKVLAQIAEENEVPLIIPFANGDDVVEGLSWSFQTAASTSTFARAITDFATQHFNDIGVIYDDNAFGQTARDFYVSFLEESGVSPVAVLPIPDTAQDYTAQLAQFQDAGAEILLAPISGTNAATLRRNMVQLGYEPIILGPPSLSFQTMIDVGQEFVEEKVWFSDMVDETRPEVQEFQEKYLEAYGHPADNLFAFVAYDAMRILAHALEAGGGDRQAVRDAIEGLDGFPSLSGTSISYSPDDHRRSTTADIKWRYVEDGRFANLPDSVIDEYATK